MVRRHITFNRRKCLAFYNPATGYGMVAANLSKKRIANLREELLRTYQKAMQIDGVSTATVDALMTAVADPILCRTADRKARSHLMHAVRDAEAWMWRSGMTDSAGLERAGHLMIAHGTSGPTGDPINAFGETIGEPLQNRLKLRLGHFDMCQVMVTLQGVEPPIWRRILIPSEFTLNRSHLVIQGAFGWTVSHLHQFQAGGKTFETIYEDHYEHEAEDESRVTFYDLLAMGCGSAKYVYDYGDNWQHMIRLEHRFLSERSRFPCCLAGERACPPEDVGGAGGYERMLKILADPAHKEYESFSEWLSENFDPEAFSVDSADERILLLLTDLNLR